MLRIRLELKNKEIKGHVINTYWDYHASFIKVGLYRASFTKAFAQVITFIKAFAQAQDRLCHVYSHAKYIKRTLKQLA